MPQSHINTANGLILLNEEAMCSEVDVLGWDWVWRSLEQKSRNELKPNQSVQAFQVCIE